MTATLCRFAPLVGFALFFGIGIFFRTWLQRRRYGQSGVVLFRQAGRWAGMRDVMLLILPVFLLAIAAGQAVAPGSTSLARLPALEGTVTVLLGLAGMAAGLFLMTAAQLQMGKSWRIGIDESTRPGLVTWGLYRYCRNPIYTAMLVALAGFFLLLPDALTLAILLATYAGVRRQVVDEEGFLRPTYAPEYTVYAARVGRFMPWLGRVAAG